MTDYVWTTKDGSKILIKDMTESHLVNALKMLEKKLGEYQEAILHYPNLSGEMAQDYAESAWENAMDKLYDTERAISILKEELARRG